MAEGYNRAELIGNLGQDPELRYTNSGKAVMGIRLATNERFKDQDGEWKDRTEWHNVTVWDKRAEGLAKVLAKGSQIFVEGALRTSTYEKDGVTRHKTEVVARKVILLGSKRDGAAGGGDWGGHSRAAAMGGGADDYSNEDIPF